MKGLTSSAPSTTNSPPHPSEPIGRPKCLWQTLLDSRPNHDTTTIFQSSSVSSPLGGGCVKWLGGRARKRERKC